MSEKLDKEKKKKLVAEAIKQYEEALIQRKILIENSRKTLREHLHAETMVKELLIILKEVKC